MAALLTGSNGVGLSFVRSRTLSIRRPRGRRAGKPLETSTVPSFGLWCRLGQLHVLLTTLQVKLIPPSDCRPARALPPVQPRSAASDGSSRQHTAVLGSLQCRSSAHDPRAMMAQQSRAAAAVLAALLLALLAAPHAVTAAESDAAAGSHGCPMCGAASQSAGSGGVTLPANCAAAAAGERMMYTTVAEDGVPLPAGPPPPGPQPGATAGGPAMADGEALAPVLDAPPMPEMCEALTAAVNAQVLPLPPWHENVRVKLNGTSSTLHQQSTLAMGEVWVAAVTAQAATGLLAS